MPPRYIDLTKMVADAQREYLIEGERLKGPLNLFQATFEGINGYEDLVVLDAAIKLAAFTQPIPRIHVTLPVCQFCDRGAGFHCNTGRTWCLACGREQAWST